MKWFSGKKTESAPARLFNRLTFSYPLEKPFTGSLVIEVPTHAERLKLAQKLFDKANLRIPEYIDFVENIDNYILTCDVKCGLRRFSCIHELSCYHDGATILNGICSVILSGIPSEKIKPEIKIVKDEN